MDVAFNFTCLDTLATSHLNRSMLFASVAANEAESREVMMKYRSMSARYSFALVAVESLGALGTRLGVRLISQLQTPDRVCDN